MTSKKDVVLVTGSSGCLGQHLVKLLQEKDDNVAEIRLYDLKNYANKLGHKETKKVTEFVADIRDTEKLLEAMEGVNVVFHTAAVIDIKLMPDIKEMESTNIDGTKAVINACLKSNVSCLIFASSTDMVCGTNHIFFGTESTTPIPKTFMIGPYGETKCKAEDLVLKASGKLCSDGETVLRTVSLRPTPFYGEGDKHLFLPFLKHTKKTCGRYYRVKSLDERLQISYVGNCAWGFIKAKERLAVDMTCSGESFFITDNTPIVDIHELVQPYLECRGFSVAQYIIPYWIAWIILSIICMCIKLINLVYPIDFDVPSTDVLNYTCSTFFFNRSKASLRLDFQPIYSPEEARSRSLPYYKSVRI